MDKPLTERKKLLKQDTFGTITKVIDGQQLYIERNMQAATPWARPLARWLARREARALAMLQGRPGFPQLLSISRKTLTRSFVVGEPMYQAKPTDSAYFTDALRKVRIMHRCGIAHNDLAKEPNMLVAPDGKAIVVDFQLASVFQKRTWWFRLLAREDLRHLLKHKRTYRPNSLTTREKAILATPAITARIWQATGKRVYLFVTRRLLNWSDREGAGDRGRR
ncbi:MAG: serine/threonine protein kinase [Woeseiaceae bacterium]